MGRSYNPCIKCTERYAGCHAVCSKGIEADKAWQIEKAKLDNKRNMDRRATDTIISLKEAVRKGKK